jgi:predicted enzyme related to lactoylglutathione lyase
MTENNNTIDTGSSNDTTPKVTGIGGIFFLSDHPEETKAWYAKNLGFDINPWGGVSFESRNMEHPEEVSSVQWCLFKKDSPYFAPSQKSFMINYTVQHIEKLVDQLKANGVTVLDDITGDEFGKFVHIMDAEGNKIELWEPVKP